MSAAKRRVSSAELIGQKTEAESRLDAIRHEQVDALEEGRDFKHSDEILLLTERSTALDKAIARAQAREEKERDRLAVQRTRGTASQLAKSMRSLEEKRLAALDEAQAAFDLATASIFKFLELCRTEQSTCQRAVDLYRSQPEDRRRIKGENNFPGDRDVSELAESEIKSRIGNYMANALRVFNDAGDNGVMGAVRWQAQSLLARTWAEEERLALEGRLERDLVPRMNYIVNSIPEDAGDARDEA